MGKKMYYSEDEAAQRLGISMEELNAQVRDAKLRVFQDGAKRMFRVDEVDALAGGGEAVELAPAAGDAVSLSEAETVAPPTKEDTVITAAGISIFDDEELEIESADPMAKTQIAPSIEDQIALEGVGSGSGLLDLTRESDDTSLGAEVLDHIDIEGEGAAAAAPPVMGGPVAAVAQEPAEAPIVPSYVEAIDASAGLFGGVAIAGAVVALLMASVAISCFGVARPGYIDKLQGKLEIVLAAAFVVVLVGAILGWVFGRATAARQAALRQMGA
jgi:hypothetical protein